MPAETASPVPPRLIVSTPAEEAAISAPDLAAAVANSPSITTPTLASRRRSKTESSALKASGVRQPSTEWVDVDDTSRQRKTTSKSSHRSSVSSSSGSRNRRNTEGEVGAGGFFPKLGRILEGTSESRSTSRPASLNEQSKRTHTPTRRHRHQDDASSTHRRPVKHRVGGVSSRRPESGFKFNPSLLSVLSSMTGTSDQSTSSSNTTITQASYDRSNKDVGVAKIATDRDRRLSESEAESKTIKSEPPPEAQLNVFDFMESSPPNLDDGHDGRSVYSNSSSGSSRYEHSDAGSSELPGTPSSHSTLPSPTSTRNPSLSGSVAESRRKYDVQSSILPTSQPLARSGGLSPELGMSGVKKVARVRTVAEEEQDADPRTNSDVGQHERIGASPNGSRSRPANRSDERLRFQEDTIRHQQGQHYTDPTAYAQQRSHSAFSHGFVGSGRAYAPHTAMQQYQYPSPPTAPPPAPFPPTPGHPSAAPPPAPEPPDFSQTTLLGYEKLALALSSPTSDGIHPCYRRFTYLQHRILLHLQDELSELEEQLRVLDEICAQQSQHHQTPASRRADFYHGSEIHHRRTALLGRIFLKIEQYQKAMKGFDETVGRKAVEEEVVRYREFLGRMGKEGIWEGERRFLNEERVGDLIVPGQREEGKVESASKNSEANLGPDMLRKFAPALILTLLLLAITPTFWGRFVVLAILAVGACMAAGAAVPSLQELLPMSELQVAGGVVLLVAVVAGMAF